VIDMGNNREIAYKSLQILTHFPINRLIIVIAPKVVKAIAPSYNPLQHSLCPLIVTRYPLIELKTLVGPND